MRLLVCGGRDFQHRRSAFLALDAAARKVEHRDPITVVIHGGASGADSIAGEWAEQTGIEVAVFPADWSQGRKAGPLRNQRMIEEGKPTAAVAFPGGRGTADMIRRLQAAGVPVWQPMQPPSD